MKKITITDIGRLDQMGPRDEKCFWKAFLRELTSDDGAAAASHLAAGRPIYYGDDEYPDKTVREWPDGHREFVEVDKDGNIRVVGAAHTALRSDCLD